MDASSARDIVDSVEKQLMKGKGRWVADFKESFREYRVRDLKFDALVRGDTRVKGFFLSRLFSFMLNPNYEVACFILSLDTRERLDEKSLARYLTAIKSFMKKEKIDWSWFLLVGTRFGGGVKNAVAGLSDRALGVALVDSESREMVNSGSYLGRQFKKYIKI